MNNESLANCVSTFYRFVKGKDPERSMCGVWRAKSLASLYALGVRAEFAFLALSQALSSWVSDVLFMMFMGEISTCQGGLASVQFSNITVASLLFADDAVLLVLLDATLEHFAFSKYETVT